MKRLTLSVSVAALIGSATATFAGIGDLEADYVLGQHTMTATGSRPIGPQTFAHPRGVAIDRSVTPNRAYVADNTYSRVLGWSNVDALTDGAAADLVIGQPNFSKTGCNGREFTATQNLGYPPSLDTLCTPSGLAVGTSGALYVVDSGNCRVLVFDDPFATDQTADYVLGDPDGKCGTAADRLWYPNDVFVDSAENVWLADTSNHRVLQYDGPIGTTDTLPDRVFAQSDFNSRVAGTVRLPEGVTLDSLGTLYIATNSQVFQYDLALTDSTYDRALGTVICNNGATASAGTTCKPRAAAIDDQDRLWVGDIGNSRILLFDNPRTLPPPSAMIGQPDYASGYQQGLIDACNTAGISADSLCLEIVTRSSSGLGGFVNSGGALDFDDAGRLYVADTYNHRVLRYDQPDSDSTADLILGQVAGTAANMPLVTFGSPSVAVNQETLVIDREGSRILFMSEFTKTPGAVIGQPDFATTGCNTGGRSASSLCEPSAAFLHGNDLWVADSGNNRVLFYEDWRIASTTKKVADKVFGQVDFATADCAAGSSGLCNPRGLAVDVLGVLYVSDTGNNRVLSFVTPEIDAVADAVFGQSDFAATECNSGVDPSDWLCAPRGLVADELSRLYVADSGNNRVLVFNNAHAGEPLADNVFGQGGSMSTTSCAAGAGGLCAPAGVDFDRADNLFIADTGNNRVLEYDDPLTDSNADRVFGQPDFDSAACNTGGIGATTLCGPEAISISDHVSVADTQNDRWVQYRYPYCQFVYELNQSTVSADVSKPTKTRVKLKYGKLGIVDDEFKFAGKNFFYESDPVGNIDEPLITFSTPTNGTLVREEVSSISNVRTSNTSDTYKTLYLKGELDKGIDDFKIREKWHDNGFATDTLDQRYRGRAVGQDLEAMSSTQATFEMQMRSTCFRTQMSCKLSNRSARCKSPK